MGRNLRPFSSSAKALLWFAFVSTCDTCTTEPPGPFLHKTSCLLQLTLLLGRVLQALNIPQRQRPRQEEHMLRRQAHTGSLAKLCHMDVFADQDHHICEAWLAVKGIDQ
eukprot:15465465-Alexandrium_andersonii.AAC.1